MVNYGSLTAPQSFLMAAIVIVTNAFGIPCVVALFKRKGLQFQAIITMMAVFTSTMYHLCEVLNQDIYLQQLKWHRLDNIFVITGISIWTLHISGSGHARKIIYSALVVSILTQQKDPWNLTYTIIPIALYDAIALIARVYYWRSVQVTYHWDNIFTSLIVLAIGGYFFIKGLDQYDDYLRFNHGIWHLMAAISNYFGMKGATCEQIQEFKTGYGDGAGKGKLGRYDYKIVSQDGKHI